MDQVLDELQKNLRQNDCLIVAVSGGPDSMALLSVLNLLKEKFSLTIVCAHVNHNVREVSKQEKVFVEEYCKNNHIIFEYMEIKNYSDDNFHNEARRKRYEFFDQLTEKYKAKYLYTAHHADDLAETILMRMMRGSTLRGYAGFSYMSNRKNYQIVRPFITISKEEIEKYCEKNVIPYVVDDSNQKDCYTRNRFRKYIIPNLKKESSHFYEKINKFSKTLLDCDHYIRNVVQDEVKKIYKNNELDLNLFFEEDRFIQEKIIEFILEQHYEEDLLLITDQHVHLLLGMIKNKKPNMCLHFPNNVIIRKSYHKLKFLTEEEQKEDYEIEIIDFVKLPNGHFIERIDACEENDNHICRLSKEDVTFPLYVRNKKNGDAMIVKGMEKHKKIKEIFIENKIEIEKRKQYPVVLDAKGQIVWLPGLKKSHFDKQITEKCDIILRYY